MVAVYRAPLQLAASPDAVPARPKVLILLAAFNGSEWIQEQLQSVLEQREVDVQVVIRDDGSTDRTAAAVDRLRARDRIEMTYAGVPTGSASQNFFSLIRDRSAEGFDFVAFADQDDIWDDDKLQRACSQLVASGAAGYSSAVTAVWDDSRERVLRQLDRPTRSDFLFEGAGQGCTFVLTADFYNRTRDFITAHQHLTEQVHFHDWATYALARSWDLQWHFDSRPTMKYRQHGGNHLGARNGISGVTKRLSLIKSGWYRAQLRAIAELCSTAAPLNSHLSEWCQQLMQPDGLTRRLQVVRFCQQGGRRRRLDRLVLVFSALAGWI